MGSVVVAYQNIHSFGSLTSSVSDTDIYGHFGCIDWLQE